MTPTFSIITGSFNHAQYLPEVIESVLSQSFEDWEHIIVDDCSTDDSWDILEQVNDPRIRTLRHARNLGGAAAYNTALSMVQGHYIANLDSDDRYHPDFLRAHREHFEADPDLAVSYCRVQEIGPDGTISDAGGYQEWFNSGMDLNDPASWVWQNHLCHGSAVIARSAHEVIGAMRPDFIYTPDWDLWIRCLASGFRFEAVPRELLQARVHANNITTRADTQLCLEYAKTSADTLNPFLLASGREDLAEANVELFFDRAEFRDGAPEFAGAILATLADGLPDLDLIARAVRRLAFRYAEQQRFAQARQQRDAEHLRDAQARAQRDAESIKALRSQMDGLTDANEELAESQRLLQQSLADAEGLVASSRAELDRIRSNGLYRFAAGTRRALRGGRR